MQPSRQTKPTVLIFEDDESVAAVERIALEADYGVLCAKTIAETRLTLDVLTIDVVLLDWRVGNECGKELLQHCPNKMATRDPPPSFAQATHRAKKRSNSAPKPSSPNRSR